MLGRVRNRLKSVEVNMLVKQGYVRGVACEGAVWSARISHYGKPR